MRSGIRHHILEELLNEWGVSKAFQIVLLAAAAASITIVVGANLIKNKSIEQKEIEYEN